MVFYFSLTKAPSLHHLVTSKTILGFLISLSVQSWISINRWSSLVMKKTSPVVSLDPERGVILMIPLPVKPYSAEKLLVNTVTSLQIQKG
jgi:hypothetical protein